MPPDWPEPSKEKVLVTQVFPEDDEDSDKAIHWMAEPLTDAATREKNKNSMRVRMEMMIMKIQRHRFLRLDKIQVFLIFH